jgi:hypothetical protein
VALVLDAPALIEELLLHGTESAMAVATYG